MQHYNSQIAIIGAGIVGIATAYYIKKIDPTTSVLLIDASTPMTLTSAQSGENYRNWWPHPTMTAFTDRSIDLMEQLAKETNNQINMNRRGYVLATRAENTDALLDELIFGYSRSPRSEVRVHTDNVSQTYQPPLQPNWDTAPSGVDVIKNQTLIRKTFPSYHESVKTVVHIRRAGAISAQQMGEHMLRQFKCVGGKLLQAEVNSIEKQDGFKLNTTQGISIETKQVVNAAGPFIQSVAAMMSSSFPVQNTLQQKIAFADDIGAIPRDMPFSIDLDAQHIDWTNEELQLLNESEAYQWLTKEMPGAIHCRPEGGDNGTWLKLGWAFNQTAETPSRTPNLMDSFPEIVLRGAAKMNPSLKPYSAQIPTKLHHYGGYYTLTDENWPLIGPTDIEGAYVVGAMSGFGTMAACAAGELCALQILESELPKYAQALSPQRYSDTALMAELAVLSQKGIL